MIEFKNVSFSYSKNKILDDISCKFNDSGLVVILGKSGSGKSTFLSLINSTLKPDSGKIINSNKITTVFQNSLLIDYLTVIENVMFPLLIKGYEYNEAKKIAREKLKEVNFEIDDNKLPRFLSGGEKMKVSLARALVLESNVIILDEPTGQLDDRSSLSLYSLFKKLSKNKLLILVTHDEENGKKIADYLYQLKDKKLILEKENYKTNTFKAIQNKDDNYKKKNTLKYYLLFTLKYLKSKKVRVIISSIFLSILLSFLYLGLNLKFSMNSLTKKVTDSYYNNNIYKIQYKKTIKKENNLSLDKYIIPSSDILKDLKINKFYYSLSYFLPENYSLKINSKESNVTFLPLLNDKNDNSVTINSSFIKAFEIKENNLRNINLRRDIQIASNSFKSNDDISLVFNFKITNIYNEIEVFNTPTIYYNYNFIFDIIKDIHLENISKELDQDTYLSSLLEDSNFDLDNFKSNELLFKSDNIENILSLNDSTYKNRIIISSKKLSFEESFKNIFEAMQDAFLLFLSLSLLSVVAFNLLSFYSLYDENVRLFALIQCFSTRKNIYKEAISNMIIFSSISILFFIIFSIIFNNLVNFILIKINLSFFKLNFSLKAILLVSSLIVLISLLTSSVPLRRVNKSKIKNELVGED